MKRYAGEYDYSFYRWWLKKNYLLVSIFFNPRTESLKKTQVSFSDTEEDPGAIFFYVIKEMRNIFFSAGCVFVPGEFVTSTKVGSEI